MRAHHDDGQATLTVVNGFKYIESVAVWPRQPEPVWAVWLAATPQRKATLPLARLDGRLLTRVYAHPVYLTVDSKGRIHQPVQPELWPRLYRPVPLPELPGMPPLAYVACREHRAVLFATACRTRLREDGGQQVHERDHPAGTLFVRHPDSQLEFVPPDEVPQRYFSAEEAGQRGFGDDEVGWAAYADYCLEWARVRLVGG